MTSLQLAVTPSMVPLGRLLVFYIRENGEGVADSLQFTVETFFENQVEHWDPNWGGEMGEGQSPSRIGSPRVSVLGWAVLAATLWCHKQDL